MESRLLPRQQFSELLGAIIRDCELIAPQDELSYGPASAANEVFLSEKKPRQPAKGVFFPQRETLVEYSLVGGNVSAVDTPSQEPEDRVLLTRPCDAASFPIIDKVFTWDYVDPSYVQRRARTTIISLACDEPCSTCFCESLGGSPAGTEGSDLVLSPLTDVYHVQIVTQKGADLVAKYASFFSESDKEHDQEREGLEAEWCGKMGRQVDLEGISEVLDFENPVWQTVAEQCIDCGVCTFLCPTCHCFDIQDEGGPDSGERVRLWDSCATRQFTKTSVHEPRPTHASRYRQRIMHKFQYYPQNFDRILCVGCGRCIEYCPAGVDLRAVLETVKE